MPCTCAAFMMMVFFNNQLVNTIDFHTKKSCDDAKPVITAQYKSSERPLLKLKCQKK